MQNSLPLNNVPEFGVSDLAFSLKKTLEETYGRVRVRGELGRLTFHSSGHMYGNIKDERASIDVVCWRSALPKLAVRPEEGLEVICTGRISTYPARSNYQLIIESMELAGEGALLKMLEQRKKALAAEGLFAPERKRPVPFLPHKIGVITSPTGAVIRDILHRLRERFPVHVQLWPVRVQGETAAAEILQALEGFRTLSDPPDVVILARGGGSLEDLMPFNEEALVRALAAFPIPVITAVGHETDTTLADYAADLRAPTPTGAAEKAVPVRAELAAQVMEVAQRLFGAMARRVDLASSRLDSLRLGDPARVLEIKEQALDHGVHKLQSGFDKSVSRRQEQLLARAGRLRHPSQLLAEKQRQLGFFEAPLLRLKETLLQQKEYELAGLSRMLETLSFENVLARGYVVVRDSGTGRPVTDAENIPPGRKLQLQYKERKTVDVTAD